MQQSSQTVATKLQEWVQLYLGHIRQISVEAHVNQEEGYKFQTVEHFQKNFDINAPHLAGNIDASLPYNNLVAGAMYLPKKMLLIYANEYSEETRQALAELFDQTKDVKDRINHVQAIFIALEERRSQASGKPPYHTYIGLRFLSLLLGLRYPDDYNPLKPVEWKLFARFIDPSFAIPHHTGPGDQYEKYSVYIDALRDYLKTRSEIAEIKDALTDGLDFKDDQYRWIAQDVIFVTARLYAEAQAVKEAQDTELPAITSATTKLAGPPANTLVADGEDTGFMPLERHLEEYVIKNWDNINFGEPLRIYYEEDGTTGQQYVTDVGIMDILALDANDDFVVIELKRAESGYKVVGQVLNYMGWVQKTLATEGQKVRGLVIVGHADKTLRAALLPVSDKIMLREYRIKMYLQP